MMYTMHTKDPIPSYLPFILITHSLLYTSFPQIYVFLFGFVTVWVKARLSAWPSVGTIDWNLVSLPECRQHKLMTLAASRIYQWIVVQHRKVGALCCFHSCMTVDWPILVTQLLHLWLQWLLLAQHMVFCNYSLLTLWTFAFFPFSLP